MGRVLIDRLTKALPYVCITYNDDRVVGFDAVKGLLVKHVKSVFLTVSDVRSLPCYKGNFNVFCTGNLSLITMMIIINLSFPFSSTNTKVICL